MVHYTLRATPRVPLSSCGAFQQDRHHRVWLNAFPLARLVAVFLVLVFSSVIESLQLFEPNRYPDMTDVISSGIGAFMGVQIGRRVLGLQN